MRQLLPPVAVSALLFVLALSYGLQYRFADALFGYFAAASVLFLALLAALSILALRPAGPGSAVSRTTLTRTAWLLVAVSWMLNVYLHSSALRALPWPLVAILPPLAAAALARWRTGAGGALFAACVLAFGAWMVATNPVDVQAANMLPLVTAGGADFLAGRNPYLGQYPEIAQILHFHYLPGMWLPYAATVAADLDPRLLNLALFVVIAVLWYRAAASRGRVPELALVLGPLLASPVVTKMLLHGHIWPYWCVLTLLTLALLGRRLALAAALLGVLLATRQLAVFIAGPLAAYMLARFGVRPAARDAAITIASFALIMLPFALWTPDFWHLTFLGLPGAGDAHVLAGNPLDQIGASGLLLQAGLSGTAIRTLQAGVVLLFLVLAWRSGRRRDEPGALLALLGVAYLWTVSLNPFLYQYHYVPGLLLLAAGLGFGPLCQAVRAASTQPSDGDARAALARTPSPP